MNPAIQKLGAKKDAEMELGLDHRKYVDASLSLHPAESCSGDQPPLGAASWSSGCTAPFC